MNEGLTRRIAEHVVGTRFEHLPPTTVAASKRVLLDAIGVMLAASGMSDDVAPFVAMAEAGAGEAVADILGHRRRTSPTLAAFANGAMAHALDYEDAFDAAPVHPNASLIPAALAAAQGFGPVSGKELIAAVAIGCDLVCRIGLSLRRPLEAGGWYPPPILGMFGAAAAAARLMGLDARQVADCFSLVMCQATCPGEIKYSPDTVLRAVREAFSAQAAIVSAELASRGVRGFEAPFEGQAGFYRLYAGGEYESAELLTGLGERYFIEDLTFKAWPACRGTHAYIELTQRLMRDHGIGAADIAEVRTVGGEVQAMLFHPEARKRRPATVIDAKFSIPFAIALTLQHGTVTLDSFGDDSLADPALHALADKVRFEQRGDWDRERIAAGSIELVLTDGRRLAAEIATPLGHPDHPLSEDDLRAKFVDCAGRAAVPLSREAALAFADEIARLETVEDVRSLSLFGAG